MQLIIIIMIMLTILLILELQNMSTDELFESIQSFDQEEAKQLFQNFIENIDSITDKDNATVLHVAANYNNHEILKYYIEFYDKRCQTHPQLHTFQKKKIWINRKDNEGFSCIHYAVFRGNSNLAFFLEQNGADIYAINKQGLTVMHIAAQGDSPVLMYYYLNKGMKISAEDSKGSTCLHWACYSGQQNSVYALLAWGSEMDKPDFTYGMTPLHLAVMSGNGRIVKKLLMRGCDRSIKNYNGKLPLDLALQNQYRNISQMIIDKRGIEQLFNVKTPYRKIDKLTFPFYFLLILYLTNYILNISFVLFQHFPTNGILAFVYLIIGLLVGILFIIICKKQPGFICIQANQNDFQMLKRNHPSKICFDCMLIKPERSRHCQICKRCVSVYDHHCPWVANCIGSHNYFWFFTFLLSIEFFMVFTVIFEIINLTHVYWQDVSFLQAIRIICIFYSLLCSFLFLIPLTQITIKRRYLIIVQTHNSLSNQTTFQRYGIHTKKNTYSSSNQPSQQRSDTLSQTLLKIDQKQGHIQEDFADKTNTNYNKIYAQIQQNRWTNCYMMCFGNSSNIKYQVGKIS